MTPVPAIKSVADFDRTIEGFHREYSDAESDSIFLQALEGMESSGARFPNYETLVFVLNSYLRKTYGMDRVLGRARGPEDEDPVLSNLTQVLRDRWGDVLQLRRSNVWDVSGSERLQDDVEFVFEQLVTGLRLEPKQKGQARPRSPVAVAKLLAVIAPSTCVIWDQRYVLNRGLQLLSHTNNEGVWRPSGDGLSYAQYLGEKGLQFSTLARTLGKTSEELSQDVTASHSTQLKELYPTLALRTHEPLTKILDEVNFLTE